MRKVFEMKYVNLKALNHLLLMHFPHHDNHTHGWAVTNVLQPLNSFRHVARSGGLIVGRRLWVTVIRTYMVHHFGGWAGLAFWCGGGAGGGRGAG